MSARDDSDAAIRVFHDEEPTFERPSDQPDTMRGLVRRYEQSFVDIDQRLKDITVILREMRADLVTERDRTDQLEREMVEHRKYVDELTARRVRAAKRSK